MELKKHLCRTRCNKSNERKVVCFVCTNSFYLSCFGVTLTTNNDIQKLLVSNSHIQFVCYDCHGAIKGSKAIVKPTPKKSQTAPSLENLKSKKLPNGIAIPVNLPSTSSSHIPSAHSTPSVTARTQEVRFDDKVHEMVLNVTKDVNVRTISVLEAIVTRCVHGFDMIVNAMEGQSAKMDLLYTNEQAKSDAEKMVTSLGAMSTQISDINKPSTTNESIYSKSVIDWSVDPEKSIDIANATASKLSTVLKSINNDDVIGVIKSSDITTWKTLDIFKSKLDACCANTVEMKTSIDKINHNIHTLNDKSNNNANRSPLVETIQMDNDTSNQHSELKLLIANLRSELNTLNENTSSLSIKLMEKALLNDAQPTQNNVAFDDDSMLALQNRHRQLISSLDNNDSNILAPDHSQLIRTNVVNSSIVIQPNVDHSTQQLNREIYITKFGIDVTCDHIYKIMNYSGNVDNSMAHAFRLTKKNQDVRMLDFVSFKIKTNDQIADALLSPNFWPPGCTASAFVSSNASSVNHQRPKNGVIVYAKDINDFLERHRTQPTTT